jgi:hypothetical protein
MENQIMGEHPRQSDDDVTGTADAPPVAPASLAEQLRPLIEDLHATANHAAEQNAPVAPAMLARIQEIRALVG